MKGSSKKKILWASRLWVGRRKEPILGYVPKNDEKKNSVHKGLRRDHKKISYIWVGRRKETILIRLRREKRQKKNFVYNKGLKSITVKRSSTNLIYI